MTQTDAFNRFRQVRDELDAARFAIRHVSNDLQNNAHVFVLARGDGITERQLIQCGRNLEGIFILRLFTDFEGVLRDYWTVGIGRTTEPDMFPLMQSIASRSRMDYDDLCGAHGVRDCRNNIAHHGIRATTISFPDCLKALGKYVRWLPREW